MAVARRLAEQSEQEGPTPANVLAFERIARCIRLTVMLAHRLDQPACQADRPPAQPSPAPQPTTVSHVARPDLRTYADRPERGDILPDLPIPDLIAMLAQDIAREAEHLGLSIPWPEPAPLLSIKRQDRGEDAEERRPLPVRPVDLAPAHALPVAQRSTGPPR